MRGGNAQIVGAGIGAHVKEEQGLAAIVEIILFAAAQGHAEAILGISRLLCHGDGGADGLPLGLVCGDKGKITVTVSVQIAAVVLTQNLPRIFRGRAQGVAQLLHIQVFHRFSYPFCLIILSIF